MAESVTIQMSHLESTRNDPKPVRGKQERPLLRSQSLADLTGFRPLSERDNRRKREQDAIETVVDLHPDPAPTRAPAPAPARDRASSRASDLQIWL